MKILQTISEAIDRRVDQGVVKFIKTTVNDPHIQAIMKHLVKAGVSQQTIDKAIADKHAELTKLKTEMPTVFYQSLDNYIEGVLFGLLKDAKLDAKAPKFNVRDFNDLMTRIRAEHKSLFPLRNHFHHKSLRGSAGQGNIKLVRGDGEITLHGHTFKIDTACHTWFGDFVFNVDFMQQLLDFAYLKVVQPKGKKYKNNGGDFDPEWCYIEFVILHEFMHYTFGDSEYGTKFFKDVPGDVFNYAADFRINYHLVKHGHEQLPIGLFNDKLNLDRQSSMTKLIRMVDYEMSGLNQIKVKPGDKIKIAGDKNTYEVVDVTLNDDFEYDFELKEVA